MQTSRPLLWFIGFQNESSGPSWILSKFKISSATEVHSGPEHHRAKFRRDSLNHRGDMPIVKFN